MATLAAQRLMEEKGFVKADYEARASWLQVCVGVFSKSLFLLALGSPGPLSLLLIKYICLTTIVIYTQLFR